VTELRPQTADIALRNSASCFLGFYIPSP
jgi:hypothetical protein